VAEREPKLRMPFSRNLLQEVFVRLPTPVAKPTYALWRHLVKDGKESLFRQAFEAATKIRPSGDYLEFGVYRGTSFILAFNTANKLSLEQMRFWAFDGFVGLPFSDDRFRRGDYACTRSMFERTLRRAGVDRARVNVVEGLYDESLTRPLPLEPNEAAVIHVDCDLYESTVPVLRYVEPMLRDRTVLIFDDWHARAMGNPSGEARAFEEWSKSRDWEVLYDVPPNRAFLYLGRVAD
jgi:O-methyltransferase